MPEQPKPFTEFTGPTLLGAIAAAVIALFVHAAVAVDEVEVVVLALVALVTVDDVAGDDPSFEQAPITTATRNTLPMIPP